jgi:SAM-dependent methyltransferase
MSLDPWFVAQPYESFMGRWSRMIAPAFIEWLSPPPGLHWLDLGCGTGALSQAILVHAAPASVLAVDPSEAFIAYARQALADARMAFHIGDAFDLPAGAHSLQAAVSGLALNFIPDPVAALRAVRQVLQPGGTLALYVWDYAGKMEMLRCFWDSAASLDPQALALDEGVRFPICQPDALRAAFKQAGLQRIQVEGIETRMAFASFDDFWSPFLGGQGPAPAYVASLDAPARQALEAHLRSSLPLREDGSLALVGGAWAARAVV